MNSSLSSNIQIPSFVMVSKIITIQPQEKNKGIGVDKMNKKTCGQMDVNII